MDDVIINKAAAIERFISRVRDVYQDGSVFLDDYTIQDTVILNIQRACQACLDLGTHIIRLQKLGIPQSSREVFVLHQKNNIIDADLSENLQKMVGFRNIAVHDYLSLNLDIVIQIVNNGLENFIEFKETILKHKG